MTKVSALTPLAVVGVVGMAGVAITRDTRAVTRSRDLQVSRGDSIDTLSTMPLKEERERCSRSLKGSMRWMTVREAEIEEIGMSLGCVVVRCRSARGWRLAPQSSACR
jgi:hypothetical protein